MIIFVYMKRKLRMVFFIIVFAQETVFPQGYSNFALSLDPLTFLGLLIASASGNKNSGTADIRNTWICAEVNWETPRQKEMGVGLFLSGNNVAITTQLRSFYNKEKQSGFFWGIYGLVEWKRMYWSYAENSELVVSWPIIGSVPTNVSNVYNSIGITGGFDIGFRIRIDNFGITPYLGLGLPLFFCFGDLPPENYNQKFYIMNIQMRAINVGLRFDLFL